MRWSWRCYSCCRHSSTSVSALLLYLFNSCFQVLLSRLNGSIVCREQTPWRPSKTVVMRLSCPEIVEVLGVFFVLRTVWFIRPSTVLLCRFLFFPAGSGGSADKFVRVVGSGRGSASRTPTRRAAVTTHTALDGSQAMNPWEGDSQLPDTDPDSGVAHTFVWYFRPSTCSSPRFRLRLETCSF